MKSGFKIGSVIGLVGLIAFLIFKLYDYRDDKARLEWLLSAREAEDTVIKPIAEYSEPDTIWDSIPAPYAVYDTLPGKSDTLWKKVPWAKLYGSVKFDTTIKLGSESNPLSIRTEVEIWYPEAFSYRNRLKVYPVVGETPYLPPKPSQAKRWGLGLSYLRSFNGANSCDYLGGSVRYKRMTLTSGYDPWQKSLISGISIELLTF